MRSAVIVYLIMLFCNRSSAQNDLPLSIDYDSLTYVDYYTGQWDSLIDHGSKAVELGAGNTLIQKRIAYAMMMKKDYFSSTDEYLKVLRQNQSDEDVLQMLVYNSAQTGDDDDARFFYKKIFTSKGIEQGHYNYAIRSIDLSSGVILNNNFSKNNQLDIRKNGVYAQQALNGELYFAQLGVKYFVAPWLNLYCSGNTLQMQKEDRLSATDLKLTGRVPDTYNGVFYLRNIYSYKDTTYRHQSLVNQQSFYMNACWLITGTFHVNLFGNYLSNQYSISFSTNNDEPYHAQVIDPGPSFKTVYHFYDSTIASNEYLIGGILEKRINKYLVQAGVSYSELNSMIQVQSNAGLKWFPHGNTNFSASGMVSYFYEEKLGRGIINAGIDFRCLRHSWLSVYGLFGDLTNASELNGFVVHNTTDRTDFRISISSYTELSSHLSLSVMYHFARKKSNYISYPDDYHYLNILTPYSSHLFSIGLKYTL